MDFKTISTTFALLSVLPFAAGFGASATPALPASTPRTSVADLDAEAWATALRTADLEERRASYEKLLERARSEREVLDQVREWAEGAADIELAWTAQLMLRELDAAQSPQPPRGPRSLRRTPSGLGRDPFDTGWIDRMLEDLGHGSLFSRLAPDFDPFEIRPDQPLPGPGSSSSRESSRFSMGPDGVKLEVEETIDGETTTRTYEAESLDELLETYPELEGKVDLEGTLPGPGPFGRLRPLERNRDWPFSGLFDLAPGLRPARPSLDVLGIRMIAPAERIVEYPGVDSGVGLQVVQVVPGSLADAIGVRPGELVVSIGDDPIASAEDVKRALASQSLEREIEVECVAPDGTRRVRRWTPRGEENLGRRLRRGSTRV